MGIMMTTMATMMIIMATEAQKVPVFCGLPVCAVLRKAMTTGPMMPMVGMVAMGRQALAK